MNTSALPSRSPASTAPQSGRGTSWLRRLRDLPDDIPVAIVGAGAMGKGLLYQCLVTPGFRCLALADLDVAKAIECAKAFDVPYRVVETPTGMRAAIDAGELAICADGELLAGCEAADVLIESTSAIGPAGRFGLTALNHEKHLVMMNAEADLIFGPYLQQQAHKQGVTYTSIDGDQHGVIKRLVDELTLWGFELVMAGNIKGYLDRYANPTSIVPEADKRNLDYRMCTAYTDGTKLGIEMALVANALGLKTATPGMHGPRAKHVQQVHDLFDLPALRCEHGPVVDYILGAEPNGGVFAVGYCEDAYQQEMMRYYKMGDGPYYIFYRPYHLCHVEAMQSVAEAVLDGRSLLEPNAGYRSDVFAYAKQDLTAGDSLDGIGGYACYGLIENTDAPGTPPGLPICLAHDVTLNRDIAQDERVAWDDVDMDGSRFDVQLYRKALDAATEADVARQTDLTGEADVARRDDAERSQPSCT